MIKVLLLRNVSPTNYGGIKKHCIELSSLFKDDMDISFLPIKDLPQKKIPIIGKTFFVFSALYKYLKQTEFDIVHIHGFATLDVVQSFLIAHWLKKKIVYSPHYHPFKYLQRPFWGRLYFYGCLRFLLRFASAIVTITDNDTAFFKKTRTSTGNIRNSVVGKACHMEVFCQLVRLPLLSLPEKIRKNGKG